MKRLFCVFSLLLALVVPVASSASSLHGLEPMYAKEALSTFSMHNILCVRNAIEEVLEDRGYFEITLSKGKHVVGEDIPAGKYALGFSEDDLGYTYWISILSESGEGVSSLMGVIDAPGNADFSYDYQPPMVELMPGQVIDMNDDIKVTFYTYNGI